MAIPHEAYLQNPRNVPQAWDMGEPGSWKGTFGLFRDYPMRRLHNILVIANQVAKQVGILRPHCLVPAAPGTK